MDFFTYQDGQLYCEELAIDELATRVGTPAYIYSANTFAHHYKAIVKAFAALNPMICYSIKSCANLNICRLLAQMGCGMDVVSGGELYRAQQGGADMSKIVYAGVGKTDVEIRSAITADIGYFNIESEAEFQNIAAIAQQMGKTVRAALRINPDVDPKTHAKTTTGKKETKFGVDLERARRFFERFGHDQHLRLTGVHLHIGSPIYSPEPYAQAITKAIALTKELQAQGYTIDVIDIGGGFGADYESDQSPPYEEYAQHIVPLLKDFADAGGTVILEPGRTIAANAGVLIMQVQYIKMGGSKKFVIVDSGMHHMIRPTLYDAWQFVWPTQVAPAHQPQTRRKQMDMPGLENCDVVGPICETGDYLALDRPLPPIARGDLLAVFGAGAYGMVMASNYNAMPRPAEVLVRGNNATIIRQRETYEDLVALERQMEDVAIL